MGLTGFMNARLDEDEATALAPHGNDETARSWTDGKGGYPVASLVDDGWGVTVVHGPATSDAVAAHIARHDPARALREVTAKRARLAMWHEALTEMDRLLADDDAEKIEQGRAIGRQEAARAAVKHDAAVYSDHPDYRQEWAPDRALPAHGRPREDLRRPPAHRPQVGSRRPVAAHHRQARALLTRRRPAVIRAQAQPWQAAPFCTTREHAAHHPA